MTLSTIRASIPEPSGRSSNETGGRKMDDMFSGRCLRREFSGVKEEEEL